MAEKTTDGCAFLGVKFRVTEAKVSHVVDKVYDGSRFTFGKDACLAGTYPWCGANPSCQTGNGMETALAIYSNYGVAKCWDDRLDSDCSAICKRKL